MQDKEKEKVIKAIGELGRRVTVADVATKTGLPVLKVQQHLNHIALDTRGHMQVGNTGDIVYSFAPGFSNAYIAKGIAAVLLLIGAKIGEVLFYLLRISFGLALILSLVIVVVLIFAMVLIMTQAMRGDRDDRGGGDLFDFSGWNFHFSFWDWMVLRDLLFWGTYNTGPVYYDYSRPTVRRPARSSFLLNCFSFLFGDGDPNEGLEEKRWQLIAQVIKKYGNVVTAEQLTPYLDPKRSNEDAVLPVLVRFNGRPEVTESGNMVYVFDSLATVAADQAVQPPQYLQEFPWKFSNVPQSELVPVYVVAGLNFLGAWTVWQFFSHLRVPAATDPSIAVAVGAQAAHTLSPLLTLTAVLCAYGTLFVSVPIIRIIINYMRNQRIEQRNLRRFRAAQVVANPSPELEKKLSEARTYKPAARRLTDQDIVYSTDKDALDQPDALSEQFSEMEKAHRPAPDSPAGRDEQTKQSEQPDDGVRIKMPKYQGEFDASP